MHRVAKQEPFFNPAFIDAGFDMWGYVYKLTPFVYVEPEFFPVGLHFGYLSVKNMADLNTALMNIKKNIYEYYSCHEKGSICLNKF
jgi:hypothetical protein